MAGALRPSFSGYQPAEIEAAYEWLERSGDAVKLVRDWGCGCCVLGWDVEGPADIIGTVPKALLTDSDWAGWEKSSRPGLKWRK